MRNLERVDLSVVQERERSTQANIRVGGYHLPAPTEFLTHRGFLEDSDLDRLFAIPEMGKNTHGNSCLIKDVHVTATSDPRVLQFMAPAIDLRSAANLEVLLFTVDPETWPLVVGDGNHRLMAHFLSHKTIADVPAFVCSHPSVAIWGFSPMGARQECR
jgi:hypothetical protein